MNLFLKIVRSIYQILTGKRNELRNWKMFSNKKYSQELIHKLLISEEPCMIGRFGSSELGTITNYIGVKRKVFRSRKSYIVNNTPPWWWEKSVINQLTRNSGFFPGTVAYVEKFCELMLSDMKELDILGSWLNEEKYYGDYLKNCKKVVLEDLEPFFSENPWTLALKNKKVLVVHPFNKTIEHQYKKRELLFDSPVLPEFELKTIKAVQSISYNDTDFKTWFEALEYMKNQIDQVDYDICILGCGAYGFPLAAHVKRSGKKAVHLGGVTQLLFGIKGKRWEEFVVWPYENLFNENWVRPGIDEKPKNADMIEGGCYW
ncbi:hypothetical protein LCM02_09320 [Lutimonas saemankumensis]|uniref:hypothetical protein n=1 Tax=Lutimonas saemankumensis TaxID=483016 RepID=UPI001CD45C81|nr:hypothetical protein [Lutimonas saemankumensis]MCA0932650.1 hypothetical protein [Lutimonas saemankumensis]